MKLNEAQQRAVEATEGPLLIIAGAGAGKTRVITNRILHLMHKGVPARAILAITFTNKAAKEMRERMDKLIQEDKGINLPISTYDRPFLSTFHALGVQIIRQHAPLLGLHRHFTIFDRSDSRRAIKEGMEACSIDPKQFDPGTILNLISRAKGDNISRLEYMDAAKDYFQETVASVWEKYENIMACEKALDFDDLLIKTARLLTDNERVRRFYQTLWQYIHIDEYQDTNKVQYVIAKTLAAGHKNICVVGDADQNIYSWRGATIENILNFEKDYPDTTVIALEQNYRSTKTILAAANSVIEKNKLRKKKTLFTTNDDGEKIGVIASYTELDEARAIADTARSLMEQGTAAKDIAVLYRANFQSRAIEEAFIKKNIPYQLVGVRFFERKEVKDVLSYIRAALNRESWSDIGRVINVPARGIGKATIAKIMSGQSESLPAGMKLKLAGFWKLLEDIRSEIMEKKPSEAVKFVIQESGLERMLNDGDAENEERLLNIRELVSVAVQYDDYVAPPAPEAIEEINKTEKEVVRETLFADDGVANGGSVSRNRSNTSINSETIPAGIEALLSNAALASDQDELEEEKDAVKLMTVHAAKGLEFDHVFIAGLEQDLFPFKHLDDEHMSASEQEEERRLFYVALTRARKKIHLSHTIVRTVYGAQRVNMPSEFIEDIDPELMENHVPEKPSGAKALFIDF